MKYKKEGFKNKKSVFFSLDALIAILLIMMSVMVIYPIITYSPIQKSRGGDIIAALSNLKIGEIDNSYVKSLIENGEIKNLNNSVLEQIGEFYVTNLTLSRKLAKEILQNLSVEENFGLWFEDTLIYSKNSTPFESASDVTVERGIISGVKEGGSLKGFSSRAYLKGSSKVKYFYFGGYVGDGNISVRAEYYGDLNDIKLEIAPNKDFNLYINGEFSGHFEKSESPFKPKVYDLNAYKSKFKSGVNIIKLVGDESVNPEEKLYIAGGYLKLTYKNESSVETDNKYYFPGIEGIINLYDGFYLPSEVDNMEIFLHLNTSNYTVFLNIGNLTLLNESVEGEKTISLSGALLGILNLYFSNRTIPLRMGLRNFTFSLGGKSDAILITDRTGSMDACDVNIDCSSGLCDSSPPCHQRRDIAAQNSDRTFINEMLSVSGNKVGLIGYGEQTNPVCSYKDLTEDNDTLQDRIDDYYNEWCGWTCISCGIYSATQKLIENKVLYGSKINSLENSSQYHLGDEGEIAVSEYFNIKFNESNFVKAKLIVFGRGVATQNGYKDCVFFNGRYIGRMCRSNEVNIEGWHTCEYPLKKEWFVNGGENNVTITGGNRNGCFNTAGEQDDWDFKDVEIKTWEYENITMNQSSFFEPSDVRIGDNGPPSLVRTNVFHTGIDPKLMKAAYLSFEFKEVNPRYFDCVYINGNYVGRVDYQKTYEANDPNWREALFEIPILALNDSDIEVKLTSGTDDGCDLTSDNNDDWESRNLNLTIVWGNVTNNYDRFMSMVVMSDGGANTKIGYYKQFDIGHADDEAIEKACEAANNYGIKIFSVAFGNGADENLMRNIACCDNCSHFYTSNNAEELLEAYKEIAQEIIEISYAAQTANITSQIHTELYPDSYIKFQYTPPPYPPGILLALEKQFDNNYSGKFSIPENSTPIDAKVISYSGNRWTSTLDINTVNVYNLSTYGNDFTILGDPYVLGIPTSYISTTSENYVNLTTGLSPEDSQEGSNYNKIIYRVVKSFISYSEIYPKAEGCEWEIEFEDGSKITFRVPKTYTGDNKCYYTSTKQQISDTNDANQQAVFKLLEYMDIDKDGKIDFKFTKENLEIEANEIVGIPYTWSTEVQIRKWK